MTRIVGQRPLRTKCCGALYRVPRYASFSSFPDEFWTDGRLVGGMQPPNFGLHRCVCGSVYLLSAADYPQEDVADSVPRPTPLPDEDLKGIVEKPQPFAVECEARYCYHRHLNDPYRSVYRQYRSVGSDGSRGNLPLGTEAGSKDPFAHPPYLLGERQKANLLRLIELIKDHPAKDGYRTLLADFYRTLGMFESASDRLVGIDDKHPHARALRQLIQRSIIAPMRYRVP